MKVPARLRGAEEVMIPKGRDGIREKMVMGEGGSVGLGDLLLGAVGEGVALGLLDVEVDLAAGLAPAASC